MTGSHMDDWLLLEKARLKHGDTYMAFDRHVYGSCWRCWWWRRCPEGRRLHAAWQQATADAHALWLTLRAAREQR